MYYGRAICLRTIRGRTHYMSMEHISDDDVERYCLGMIDDEAELALLEEHVLTCPACARRAEQAQD